MTPNCSRQDLRINLTKLPLNGEDARTSLYAPLQAVLVEIEAPAQVATVAISVAAGHCAPYFSAKTGLRNGKGRTEFTVQGNLGRHVVRAHINDECNAEAEFRVTAETDIHTANEALDGIYPAMRTAMQNDMRSFFSDGRVLKGNVAEGSVWLRDNAYTMRSFRYWEPEMVDLVDHFVRYQMANGGYYDYTQQFTDRDELHANAQTYGLMPDLARVDEEHMLLYKKVGVEADMEYLAVAAVYYAWQATGDDEWMFSTLERLEKGLNYSMTDKYRWSEEYQLVKRAFTIDTWDFEYGKLPTLPNGEKVHHRSEIDADTKFCIMHGDNSGMYRACALLSEMFRRAGNTKKAGFWEDKAKHFRKRTNEVCWNGRFYTHQVHIDPVEVPGVDEGKQLSLSNPVDINRGVCEHHQAVSIIKEYLRRRETSNAFAEWFTIDPPFPDGVFGIKGVAPGEYVNGGIAAMVGGELARAAFEHGFEGYGVDILRRYHEIVSKTHKTCFTYFPAGYDDPHISFPNNAWGAGNMIYALVEGLAGIVDRTSIFREVRISPRWLAADVDEASCCARYAASDGYFAYTFAHSRNEGSIRLRFTGSSSIADFHVLLPGGAVAKRVVSGNKEIPFANRKVEESPYVDFAAPISDVEVMVTYEKKTIIKGGENECAKNSIPPPRGRTT